MSDNDDTTTLPGALRPPQSNPFINDVEYVDEGAPVQCASPGCGVLLNADGMCPRCTHPAHITQAPKRNRMRVQCGKLGCGCVLDERGLCPRCYPLPPED